MHAAIKKGLLWQQRERLFSRWKERFFILTRDYLHCFKRSSGGPGNITDMGHFIFKVKLVEVDRVEWINKKSYSTVGLKLQARESRILLRAGIGLEDWFELLEECTMTSKERRHALRKLHDPDWHDNGRDSSFSSTLHDWITPRVSLQQHMSDSVPDLQAHQSRGPNEDLWRRPPVTINQRLSLLTDIDINSYNSQLETPPPSMPPTFRGQPCRLNSDIFFVASVNNSEAGRWNGGSVTPSICSGRSILTPVGSMRSSYLFTPSTAQQIKYRDRSQSDAFNWKTRNAELKNRRSSYIIQATNV